ncbi:MAG: TIR domain-containing protein, partial [Nitrosopumilus sp.]
LYKVDNDSILIKIDNILKLLHQYNWITENHLIEISKLSATNDSLLRKSLSEKSEVCDQQIVEMVNYLTSIILSIFNPNRNFINNDNEEIKILQGKDLDLEIIEKSLRVYKIYFGESDLGPSKEYLNLHEHNPDMYYYAIDPLTNEIVGNLEIIPFDEKYLEEYEGGMHDAEFLDGSYSIDKIQQYKIPGIYSIVVELIAIDPQYKGYRAVLRKLLTTFVNKLLFLAQDDIFIRNIYTDIYTNEGEKLATHFGFKKVRKTIDGHLYKMSLLPPEFISQFPTNVKMLKEVYSDRFEQYQKLIESSSIESKLYGATRNGVKSKKWKYAVGLSFSGNERIYVEKVAEELRRLGVEVFYDDFEKVELWGKDLYQYLSTVYKDQCQFCIVFISKSYAEKLWTRHEIKSVQTRAFETENEYLLPVRMDDTEIPGINSTTGYIDARNLTPEKLASLTYEKIKM